MENSVAGQVDGARVLQKSARGEGEDKIHARISRTEDSSPSRTWRLF